MDGGAHVSGARELTLNVRLFAMLRERAGADTVQLRLAPGATVADALRALAEREELREPLARMRVVMAVNREYADPGTSLCGDDELALIPPLSGGSEAQETFVRARVSGEPLSREQVRAAVSDPRAGAIVVFEGVTREVERLDYEAYETMAHDRLQRIARECVAIHDACAIAVEHRVGEVPLGEPSVIVAVSAPHRAEAFAAAREAIDRIKAESPIWKREVLAGTPEDATVPEDGRAQDGGWVQGTPAPLDPAPRLTHVGADGAARMVDVGAKPVSERVARARARVRMSQRSARAVRDGDGPKGEVLGVARIAGIQAAKQTALLIPLAHPLPLSFIDVSASVDVDAGLVELIAEARTVARTGVEMEAMSACAVAALTVYDMVKGLERGIELEQVVLLEKRGGRSDYVHAEG
ncbi:MAG TPA: cyclic pyranopterin monophosphate synthase MoaC [Solirubrobacteraceae bacterium]|nr:cyclic pyranopterin monophosphate synthase MoaC [Solirubrobacteraceae bacterium]